MKRKIRLIIKIIAILFGASGILSLFISVRINHSIDTIIIETKNADNYASRLKLIRYSDRRVFSGELYSRATLDSLEHDFSNYADWIERYQDYIDINMEKKDSIDLFIIGCPSLSSSLSSDLVSFKTDYLECISNYNNCVKIINQASASKTILERYQIASGSVILLLLIASFILELVIAVSDYYSEKK